MEPNTSTTWSAKPAAGVGLPAGYAIISSGTASWVIATAANRALYGRSDGLAVQSTGPNGEPALMVTVGRVANAITGLGAGAASWVRVSATGLLERCAPSGSDDIVGRCEANGDLHADFGFLTAALVT